MEPEIRFRDALQEFIQAHHVPDIVGPMSKLIFILESPHVQELKYGAPVSGASGATMSKHLFGAEFGKVPLGLLLRDHSETDPHQLGLSQIGLVNVSNVPLQRSAYSDAVWSPELEQWIRVMERIRSTNQMDVYRDSMANEVQNVLLESLRNRLAFLTQRACTLVPCGRFAQKFFRLANVESRLWTVIAEVPHPSYNSWDKAQYQPALEQVKLRQKLISTASEPSR